MKRISWKHYVLSIALAEAVGGLSGYLTREGTRAYANGTIIKPPLSPPVFVFPVVWTVLFALMGIGAARVFAARPSSERSRALRVYCLQLAFNFLWSIIFFNLRRYGFAFFWLLALWLLIVRMLLSFRAVDHAAAGLQLPYLLWVSFAAYLNLGVWLLNG